MNAHKVAPDDVFLPSYHLHKDKDRTVEVCKVSLGLTCEFIVHTSDNTCSREKVEGTSRYRSKDWAVDGMPTKGAKVCAGCQIIELNSGDIIWGEFGKVIRKIVEEFGLGKNPANGH